MIVPENVSVVPTITKSELAVKSPSLAGAVCDCVNNPVVTMFVASAVLIALIAAVLVPVVVKLGIDIVVSNVPSAGMVPDVAPKAPAVNHPTGVVVTTDKLKLTPTVPETTMLAVSPVPVKVRSSTVIPVNPVWVTANVVSSKA